MIQRLLLTAIITALLIVPNSHSTSLPQFQKTRDFYLSVAMGLVPGYSFIEKFGENPDIDSGGTFEDIWDGGALYVNPTAASLHNVVSSLAADTGTLVSSGTATGGNYTTLIDADADFVSDAVAVGDRVLNDTNVMIGTVSEVSSLNTLTMIGQMRNPSSGRPRAYAGVLNTSTFARPNAFGDTYRIVRDGGLGASIFWVQGLSGTLLDQSEFVLLNGVGVVATTKLYSTQYRARIFTTGTAGADGNITSTAQSGGTVSAQILGVGGTANQTLMTPFTCAINKECLIVYWAASMSKSVPTATSDLHLMGGSLAPGAVRYVLNTSAITTTGSSDYPHPYPIPIPIPGGSSIWLAANSSTNDVGVSARMSILVVDLQ